jgi:coenzyme F420-dependent glucose-6-phosphate dehydrogenase
MRPDLPTRSLGYMCYPDFRDPRVLLRHALTAQQAGFEAIWVTDHFHPWFHTGAFESHSWIWMSAAMQIVRTIPFGTAVTAPILRYHPALVAQAFATMHAIYGDRVILGVGTGEGMNEIPLGFSWPTIRERRARVVEAIKIMRKLWAGGLVDFHGQFYDLKANLYMKASIPIYIAATGPRMARVVGQLGDGFICNPPTTMEYVKTVLFPQMEDGAKTANRSYQEMRKVYELDVTYANDYDQALSSLKHVVASLSTEGYIEPISDPRQLETMSRETSIADIEKSYVVGTTPEDHIKRIEEVFDAGFDHVYILSFSPDEEACMRMYKKQILPYFAHR